MDEKADAGNKFEQSLNSDTTPDSPDVEHGSTEKHEQVMFRAPEAPYTIFSTNTRVFIIFMVATSAMISPFAATSYYPALNTLAKDLHVSSSLINLTITTYMVCLPSIYHADHAHYSILRSVKRYHQPLLPAFLIQEGDDCRS
jgi:hypothetical protein